MVKIYYIYGESDYYIYGCYYTYVWCSLARLYELFVGTLISVTNAYAGCGRLTLNFIKCIDLGRFKGRSIPTAKPLHLLTLVENVYQSNMNMNLKMFCKLCLILYCLISLCIFYATQVKSEKILLLFWNSLILSNDSGCHEDQRLCRTNDIRFI